MKKETVIYFAFKKGEEYHSLVINLLRILENDTLLFGEVLQLGITHGYLLEFNKDGSVYKFVRRT